MNKVGVDEAILVDRSRLEDGDLLPHEAGDFEQSGDQPPKGDRSLSADWEDRALVSGGRRGDETP